MEAVKLEGMSRTDMSRKAITAERAKGNVPCVLYGGEQNVHFYVSAKALKTMVYTPDFKTAEVTVNGKSFVCFIQDVQFDPIKDNVTHVDFLELTEGKKVVVELPVKFVGTSKGVRAGGKLIPRLRKLKVKSLPSALRSNLEINVEELELGKNIRVKDVKFEGMDIITAANNPIVSAFITRQLKQAEEAAKSATPAKAAAPAAAKAAPAAKK
jgi:large subunit ribosomal protein L25